MGAHQIHLQLADILRGNAHVRQMSYAGIHRVGHAVVGEQVVDHRARAFHRQPCLGLKQDGTALINYLAHFLKR